MFTVLAWIAEPGNGSRLPWILLGGTSLYAAAAMALIRRTQPRRIKLGIEPASLFSAHVALLIALAAAPALVGFVGFFLGGGLACYVAGLAVCHGLLALAIPSTAMVDRLQGWLYQLGYEIDLHSAILAES